MNRSFRRFLQLFFLLLDLAALNTVYFLAQVFFPEGPESHQYMRYTQYFLVMNGSWLLCSLFSSAYSPNRITFFSRFMRASLRAYVLWGGINLLYLALPRLILLSSSLVFFCVIGFMVGIFLTRILYLGIRRWMLLQIHAKRKILIMGSGKLAQRLSHYLVSQGLGLEVAGFIDDSATQKKDLPFPLFPGIDDTLRTASQLRVNEIYSTIMPENNAKVYRIMQEADKRLIRFRLVPDFSQLIDRPVHVDFFDEMPVLTIRKEPLEEEVNRFVKRSFDIIVSSLVTVFFLSWMFPLIGLLIKLETPGPILFVQLRSGKNNRPFRCFKFRSMGVNREANSTQATKNDKRVTRIGRFLRKTSLDEFPQFLNVLMGDMSIVGPRPHMLKHTKDYSNLTEDYMIRQFLKPGITGWAQVNGYRGEITELIHIKKRVEYDLYYLEHWSIWLDLRIMFLTVYNVIKGEENAY